MKRGEWYEVAPRYTPGSPALVEPGTAARVAEHERKSYLTARAGIYGSEEQARAERLGLAGIVWSWRQAGRLILAVDHLTDEHHTITTRPGSRIAWPWAVTGRGR